MDPVLTRIVNPVTARQIVGIVGMGDNSLNLPVIGPGITGCLKFCRVFCSPVL
jgi:hypothetical protein